MCPHWCTNNKQCNFKKIGNKCFYLFKDMKRDWFDSKIFCETQSMSMAVITKEMIQDHNSLRGLFNDLPDYLVDNAVGPQTWLGGRAKTLP